MANDNYCYLSYTLCTTDEIKNSKIPTKYSLYEFPFFSTRNQRNETYITGPIYQRRYPKQHAARIFRIPKEKSAVIYLRVLVFTIIRFLFRMYLSVISPTVKNDRFGSIFGNQIR